ncbi:PAS domain S-box protein [Desulfococcaceae bacterium HSG8]|nr:PAS domain S-box protein [Desulfococcaceae bacterium HSG8]
MKKYNILLTDDDSITLEGVCANLELEGYNVVTAGSGEAAIRILNEKDFDLVITDLVMIPTDGIEVLKKAKKLNHDTMVIIFTAHADISSAIEAVRFDADDYLTKPYDVDELYFRVSRCFEKLEHRRKMKTTEEALRESEENFRALAENANDGILIISEKGIHVYANRRFSEITGYSIPELIQTDTRKITPWDEFRKITENHQKRLEGKDVPISYETCTIHKSGHTIFAEVTSAKTVWQGQPAVMEIFRDITERELASETLRIKDSAIESSISAIVFCDLRHHLTYVNRSFLELWGYDNVREVLGRSASEFWKDERLFPERVRILQETGSWIGESVAIKKDFSLFHAQISANMITDRSGKPLLVMASVIDISEKKRMEEALKKSNEDLEHRVQERTTELMSTAEELERKQEDLMYHKAQLERVNDELVDTNKALTVLARNVEKSKDEAEKKIALTIRSKIIPIIEGLKRDRTLSKRRAELDVASTCLHDLVSDLSDDMEVIFSLSPVELQIATMIKNGLTSRGIAEQLNISPLTVKTHRKNIRKKLNIRKSDINLTAYLRSKLEQ